MQQELVHQLLYDMVLAREFEQVAAEQYTKGKIAGFLHLYPGEEAVAVGTLRAADLGDYIVTTYREHVHALVWGISPNAIMAELFGRSDGCCHGYGGSMHLFDAERRFLGGYAVVGETFPVALGAAYWVKMKELPDVVICYFGDGAVNQGTFHESMNMAALWQLPILFVCENNHYQIGTEIHRHSAVTELHKRACAYNVAAKKIDGMDVLAVHTATRDALNHIREGNGPFLLECETYRFRGHSMADNDAYRSSMELSEFKARDPLLTLRSRAEENDWIKPADYEAFETQAKGVVSDAVVFADNSPPPTDLYQNIYQYPLNPYTEPT